VKSRKTRDTLKTSVAEGVQMLVTLSYAAPTGSDHDSTALGFLLYKHPGKNGLIGWSRPTRCA
jgi:hypothetical protein